MVRYTNCGDGTNSRPTEGAKPRRFRSMLVSESNSFPVSDTLRVDGVTPRHTLPVKMMGRSKVAVSGCSGEAFVPINGATFWCRRGPSTNASL